MLHNFYIHPSLEEIALVVIRQYDYDATLVDKQHHLLHYIANLSNCTLSDIITTCSYFCNPTLLDTDSFLLPYDLPQSVEFELRYTQELSEVIDKYLMPCKATTLATYTIQSLVYRPILQSTRDIPHLVHYLLGKCEIEIELNVFTLTPLLVHFVSPGL